MKRVIIIVEGQTEQEFVKEILAPYLQTKGINDVRPILIKTSKTGKGGFVNYEHLRNTILPFLSSQKDDFIITTLVDYFRIPTNIPEYNDAKKETNKIKSVEILESSINDDINNRRFFSYIQLHEFEALLFSNDKGFKNWCDTNVSDKLIEIIQAYPNPEEINSTPEGAPSKRILAIHSNYEKIIEGNLIAMEVGINDMLDKCPRFNNWITKIIEIATLD